jgi:hypothetical protein
MEAENDLGRAEIMNHSTRDADVADGTAADYRIREVEARLDRRLASIEAQRVRAGWGSKLSGLGFVLVLVALALVFREVRPSDGAWTMDSVSTQEIVLRDAEGIERGRLATDSEGRAHLALSDRNGRERLRLSVLADGSPGVTISDSDARPRAVLGYLADGTANLVFADEDGISRAVFGLEPDGSTQAVFADRSGAVRTLVGVGADGVPAVSIFEADADVASP